jgi:predicted nucleotidyltransferase
MKILHRATVGSVLHRTNSATSDVDIKTVYKNTLEEKLDPFFKELTIRNEAEDETLFELEHFTRMVVKNNPTAMEIGFSDMFETGHNSKPVRDIAELALDTELYTKHCNGFIHSLRQEKNQTPKRLHHAARMATHLDIYLMWGTIEYNVLTYPNYDYLMSIKRGETSAAAFDFRKREIRQIWHSQLLDDIREIVYTEYTEGIT